MRYYISDLHFFHEALLTQMDCRDFPDLETMHEAIIERWNARVKKKDEVVILGDFSVGKGPETLEILKRLRGRLYMVIGNHDRFLRDKKIDWTRRFRWIGDYREMHDARRKIILSHYPIFCYNGQYHFTPDGDPRAYMLYGHVHNTFDEVLVNRFVAQTKVEKRALGRDGTIHEIPCNMINCFCGFSDYTPLTLDEWIEVDRKRRSALLSGIS